MAPQAKVRFWRDSNGVEVDWVIEVAGQFIPIEVKWSGLPKASHGKSLLIFMKEYDCPVGGFVISRTAKASLLAERVEALPWRELLHICELAASLE
jgi:predicted AAA+ superfamily ATPase